MAETTVAFDFDRRTLAVVPVEVPAPQASSLRHWLAELGAEHAGASGTTNGDLELFRIPGSVEDDILVGFEIAAILTFDGNLSLIRLRREQDRKACQDEFAIRHAYRGLAPTVCQEAA